MLPHHFALQGHLGHRETRPRVPFLPGVEQAAIGVIPAPHLLQLLRIEEREWQVRRNVCRGLSIAAAVHVGLEEVPATPGEASEEDTFHASRRNTCRCGVGNESIQA